MQIDQDKHINSYLHEILTFLKSSANAISFTDLYSKLNIDIHSNTRLLKALENNDKILIKNNFIQYLYTYNIQSKEDLINIFSKRKEGIELSKLRDNPIDISDFLDDFLILKDNDGIEVVFYDDMRIDKADDDIVALWKSVRVPGFQDLISEMSVAGIKTNISETVKRKAIIKKTKSKRYRRNIKITNTHVKGLDLNKLDE
ncbi:hypothetical protein NCER_100965 [Vairimorpha ceranae BRL01]|uniref:TFIIE beta domain-containing protein n=2 Tax=Vairimorpha ceranae TaxID=40302 RepID=C4V8W5_VAIC1|nr:transcription initiation factor tfiie beta subunit [Vairimorpha ceranae]EEQ82335.1 hypothetical protein NCER_100965 [Vairimorpha ceranae BRL01]KAF5140229.1 hypothetical protein G9O61_00g016160 [Vairimorpha ceranae]KKO76477.1 transcription initiation factor tfiie beta subunit [Vairimorpha ceranae]